MTHPIGYTLIAGILLTTVCVIVRDIRAGLREKRRDLHEMIVSAEHWQRKDGR